MNILERREALDELYFDQEWDHALTPIADNVRDSGIAYEELSVVECAEFVLDNAKTSDLDLGTGTDGPALDSCTISLDKSLNITYTRITNHKEKNMNDFTASNGLAVDRDADGDLTVRHVNGDEALHDGYILPPVQVALHEFFQAERDEELGRWRDPDNPDFVVYRKPSVDIDGNRYVRVLRESTSHTYGFWETGNEEESAFEKSLSEARAVSDAYFAAHPKEEPKPWLEAQPGEVWNLKIEGTWSAVVVSSTGQTFRAAGFAISITNDNITAGVRVDIPKQDD